MNKTAQKIKRILTLSNFRRWLKTRNPNEHFLYASNNDCAIARFLKSNRLRVRCGDATVLGSSVEVGGDNVSIPKTICHRMDLFLRKNINLNMGNFLKFFK